MNWFIADGIPIAPYDDAGKPNQYPLMRLRLRNDAGTTLATTDIVLPVSDEMDCKLCHLSGSGNAAKPAVGWVFDPNPGRDYRLNILRLHDQKQAGNPIYAAALVSNQFNAAGLYATVVTDKHPFICASCHVSEALPLPPLLGIKPLTTAVHGRHAGVIDPRNGQTLDAAGNRLACYTCHPGSVTRCLRGAMGQAVAADGSMAMQCQSCHGKMSDVGAVGRTGWLEEPNCQSCHVGTATNSTGVIRFTTATHAPAEMTFATNPDTPLPGTSLYRFSRGHGGLQCSACHGSTHAEYPSAFRNDNLQSQAIQGHVGVLMECSRWHGSQSLAYNGGPHGMHPVTSSWATSHADASRSGPGVVQCKACHGVNYKGTVLSQVQSNRTVSTKFGTRNYWRGTRVSCYNCHNGVNSSDPTTKGFPTVVNTSAITAAGVPVVISLSGSNLRIVNQPTHGTVALSGTTATYYPEERFAGADAFTFAANNGFNDSNLGTVTLTVNLVDADSDGLPDWWEKKHGGTATALSATADLDGDGYSNLQEYLASSDPLDLRSALRSFHFTLTGSVARVEFTSNLGQIFAVERTDDIAGGIWTNVSGVVWGLTDTTSFAEPVRDSPARRFFRVRLLP